MLQLVQTIHPQRGRVCAVMERSGDEVTLFFLSALTKVNVLVSAPSARLAEPVQNVNWVSVERQLVARCKTATGDQLRCANQLIQLMKENAMNPRVIQIDGQTVTLKNQSDVKKLSNKQLVQVYNETAKAMGRTDSVIRFSNTETAVRRTMKILEAAPVQAIAPPSDLQTVGDLGTKPGLVAADKPKKARKARERKPAQPKPCDGSRLNVAVGSCARPVGPKTAWGQMLAAVAAGGATRARLAEQFTYNDQAKINRALVYGLHNYLGYGLVEDHNGVISLVYPANVTGPLFKAK